MRGPRDFSAFAVKENALSSVGSTAPLGDTSMARIYSSPHEGFESSSSDEGNIGVYSPSGSQASETTIMPLFKNSKARRDGSRAPTKEAGCTGAHRGALERGRQELKVSSQKNLSDPKCKKAKPTEGRDFKVPSAPSVTRRHTVKSQLESWSRLSQKDVRVTP